jgi:AraC-like DNA-binding protein
MHYREVLPDRRLRHALKCYWFLSGRIEPQEHDRILPDGCCELIFHCGDQFTQQLDERQLEQPRTLLIGPTTRAVVVRPGRMVDVIGVRFRPGGAALLGGAPARELRDRALDAHAAGVQLPRDLLERIADAQSDRERTAVLDGVFSHQFTRTHLDQRMLALQYCIVAGGGEVRTRFLAEAAGLSTRQLQRRFLQATGVTPKLLSRLVRLQRALTVGQQRGSTLASVAAAAGYADQAHFTRDFREFAGVSPSEYFRGPRELSDLFVADEERYAS